jgi:hypothetical protein
VSEVLPHTICDDKEYLTFRNPYSPSTANIPKLAYALTKQSFIKQVLTEGDKLIVSRISPIEDQGGYGLALNYGEPCMDYSIHH